MNGEEVNFKCQGTSEMEDSTLDASQVLAAALEQMDDIIAGNQLEMKNETSPFRESIASKLLNLQAAIEKSSDNEPWEALSLDCLHFIHGWLVKVFHHFGINKEEQVEELKERIRILEKDKENLLLQVNVLNSQIEIQNEKIEEMEKNFEEGREKLKQAELTAQQEATARSASESERLELATELSALRTQIVACRREGEERAKRLQNELILAQARLLERETELLTLRSKLARNGTIISPQDSKLEVDSLRRGLNSLMSSNQDKDKVIEELKKSLYKYKQLHQDSLHHRKAGLSLSTRASSEDSLLPHSPAGDHMKLFDGEGKLREKPPPFPRQPPLTSPKSPGSSPSSLTSSISSPSTSGWPFSPIHRASSAENVLPSSPTKTPPMVKRHYVTMPRQHSSQFLRQIQEHQEFEVPSRNGADSTSPVSPLPSPQSALPDPSSTSSSRKTSGGVSFGKGFFRLRKGTKLCTSAPELAQPESTEVPDSPRSTLYVTPSPPLAGTTAPPDKHKGILRLFDKLKRSGSTSLDPKEASAFKRGGVRATTGPRLGSSRNIKVNPDLPFSQWGPDLVSDWFYRQGLGMYMSGRSNSWITSGQVLLDASPSALERELGIRHPLHRKKLILALQSISGRLESTHQPATNMDNPWVIRWLDDIGLPQYKDAFSDARIDGLVLHFLTIEDLFSTLKINNQLHFLSLRRGIQVLRHVRFEPRQLKRRSLPDENKGGYGPGEVVLWTNHRVMEWLRTVDLAEYAPNLRGSGVHGALMVLEPRFTAEVMAALLNIPPSKTLLRRHLTTQFRHLVGRTIMAEKREYESQAPLLPSAKIKPFRKSHFSLRRYHRSRSSSKSTLELELDDFVCPLDLTGIHIVDDQQQVPSHPSPSTNPTTEDESGGDNSSLSSLLQDDRMALDNLEASTV